MVRKANPGFLDWVVDAEKGLFSPLTEILLKAVDPTGLLSELRPGKEEALALKRYLREGLPSFGSPKPPYTPDSVYKERFADAEGEQTQAKIVWALSTLLEVIPFLDAGIQLSAIYQCPKFAAALRRAQAVYLSEFQVGELPYIQRYWLKQYKPFVPPIQDLRLMAVREAFPVEPGEPQYREMGKWALEHGMDPFWTERYLYMGFERMDVRDAMKYFLWYHDEKPGYEDWLRIADIHPDDRPRVSEVSYTVPSLRELGYGYDVGRYTRDDIRDARRRGGLSPADAEKAADSMVAYRTEAEREAVRREHMHLYALGKETISQFEAHIRRLGTAPAAVPLWLERADLEKARREREPAMPEQRTVSASEALTALETGIRTEAWTRAKLADLYWTPERIDLAIERVKWQDRAGDEIRKRRGVLEDMLKEGFLKKGAFTSELKAMNFTPTVIAALEAWAEEASEWDDVKEQAAEWWRLAKAGKITPEGYAGEVRKLGMTEERITSKMKLLRRLAEIRATEEAAKG